MKGLKRIEAVHTTIFMLLILYFMLVILACGAASNGPHSNIHSLESLKKKHNFGPSTENETTFRDEEYDSCMSTILQSTTKDAIFGPFYLFVIEFSPITFVCTPCYYSTRPEVTWIKLSFENVETKVEDNDDFKIDSDGKLRIQSPKASDFGTYYCQINGYVGFIWTLEVEPFKYFDIVKARHWKSSPVSLGPLKVSMKWGSWSTCNKCDRVGKRHRLGYCYVEKGNLATNASGPDYQALQVYKKGLSCNLFLLIHPDADPDTIEALSSKPVLVIGYCKTSCDYYDTPPETLYAKVHPKIHLVYEEQLEMKADLELKKLKLENRGNRGFVPGKPTLFEGLILGLLLSLQLYILIHICRNWKKAK